MDLHRTAVTRSSGGGNEAVGDHGRGGLPGMLDEHLTIQHCAGSHDDGLGGDAAIEDGVAVEGDAASGVEVPGGMAVDFHFRGMNRSQRRAPGTAPSRVRAIQTNS